jgi:large subunit ribosomal protein L17
MFRNMVTSLLKHDRIKTTDVKAKELRRWADQIVTLAKRGDLHARRVAMSIVREKDVVHKIFEEAAERFGAINGGYTRIVKIGRRPGDAATITLVELVSSDAGKPVKTNKRKAKTEVTPTDADAGAKSIQAAATESKQAAVDDSAVEVAGLEGPTVDIESGTTTAEDAAVKEPKAIADPDENAK